MGTETAINALHLLAHHAEDALLSCKFQLDSLQERFGAELSHGQLWTNGQHLNLFPRGGLRIDETKEVLQEIMFDWQIDYKFHGSTSWFSCVKHHELATINIAVFTL